MEIVQFVADALGDASYLVVSGGDAAVVDPQRDVRPYVAAAERRGVRITHVFETHVHNDYISGGPELAALRAEIVAPAGAGLEFPHHPVADGDEVRVGGATIRAIDAPGHTHHHTAYLAIDEDGAVAGAFTGGSIIIGGAGRSDLLGPDETEALTQAQWDSSHRIASMLPEAAEVLPTHGAGSFCSTQSCSDERRAPLSVERTRNVVFTSPDFAAFRDLHIGNPAPIPGYYQYMAPINRSGPRLLEDLEAPIALSPVALEGLLADGVQVLDVRTRFAFAEGHVPGSLSFEEGGSMLAYVGWAVPFNAELALVTDDLAQSERVATDLLRIGYDQLRGCTNFTEWSAERVDTPARFDVVDVAEAWQILQSGALPVYDVRFDSDRRELEVPGTLHRPLDRIQEWLPTVTDEAMLLFCGAGARAATAASMLEAAGHRPRVLLDGGADDLVRNEPPRVAAAV